MYDIKNSFRESMKSPMLLRRSLFKTKHFVHKTLNKFKSFLLREYRKLPRDPFISASSRKRQDLDDFYRVFAEHYSANLEEMQKGKKEEDGECIQTTEQTKIGNDEKGCKNNEEARSQNGSSSRVLALKMKEFEMFEVNDVDHQLDIEEVLHYYDRLTSPVFVDIVDNFFMDMYSEFVPPQPSTSVNSSMRRLGPVKLSSNVS